MATFKEKMTVVQRISASCPTHARTDISVRDVETVIDEPKERDGTNLAPTPTETLVASLMGCTNVIFHKCAHKHGIDIKEMSMEAEAVFDRRGTTLQEELEVPFESIKLTVNIATDASAEALERAKADLRRFCPVSKVIRNAGTPIEEVWNVSPA